MLFMIYRDQIAVAFPSGQDKTTKINKAQHVSTGRGSISRIYLEKNTYAPY